MPNGQAGDQQPERLPGAIGHYVVEGFLGTGGFATVYLARDERLNAQVAVKVLADNHSRNDDIRRRFLEEGQVIRRLDSERIIKVYDIGETEAGQPYLVLELADLGDLRRRVDALQDDGWSPTSDDLVAVIEMLGQAMATIHHHDLVHRDLNPGNILFRSSPGRPRSGGLLLGENERMMVSDLGLAKDVAQNSGFTVGAGTSAFQAPEQTVAYGAVDNRADLYSAAALIVWLLTGSGPRDLPDWPGVVGYQGWPAAFIDTLRASLAQQPDDRPATAEAWQQRLLTALGGAAADPSASTGRSTDPTIRSSASIAEHSVPPKTTGRRALLIGGAALVLGVGGLGVWAARDTGSSVERLDNGDARVAAQATTGQTLAIEGPDRLTVGDVGRYHASVGEGLANPTWLAPDGVRYTDEPIIEVEMVSEGRAPVQLMAQTAGGEEVSVTMDVEISN